MTRTLTALLIALGPPLALAWPLTAWLGEWAPGISVLVGAACGNAGALYWFAGRP